MLYYRWWVAGLSVGVEWLVSWFFVGEYVSLERSNVTSRKFAIFKFVLTTILRPRPSKNFWMSS